MMVKENILNWKRCTPLQQFKEGTICRTEDGEFVIVGEINTSRGVNDEFTEEITHYTEYFCKDVESKLKFAKLSFNSMDLKYITNVTIGNKLIVLETNNSQTHKDIEIMLQTLDTD
jgi:hypothetical protein